MIAEIITLLQSNPFYGAGKFTEIAKGQNEIATRKNAFEKIKRQWRSRKKLM
jgi:hypothetical protein